MKYSKKATSILEAMTVLLIVVTGITGVYSLLHSSMDVSISTANRIEAISIARDGLEGLTNIRDTNWLVFAADYENCWNVLSYNSDCIGVETQDNKIRSTGGAGAGNTVIYSLYKNTEKQFELEEFIKADATYNIDYTNPVYRDEFGVRLDNSGFYTQTGTTYASGTLYTRHFEFQYVDTDGSGGPNREADDLLGVEVVVSWVESSSEGVRELRVPFQLSNWKAKR